MSQLVKYPNALQDDRLAEFTDQALAGNVNQAELNADAELLALEETILRLKNAFPSAAIDQPAVKQMQVRFNVRVRHEAQTVKQPFWKKWFEPQLRLQFGMAFTAMALLIAFTVFAPYITTVGSSTSAIALIPMKNIFMASALVVVFLIFLWITRRK